MQVEVVSDDDDEEEDDIIALTEEKYKPTSLEKMISLIALLAEKSRQDRGLVLPERDYFQLTGGKVRVNSMFLFLVQCSYSVQSLNHKFKNCSNENVNVFLLIAVTVSCNSD